MSIGTTIKKLRRDRNITQERLAEMMGVSTNAVSQWECEKTAPDISHLPILANIFEVSADILLRPMVRGGAMKLLRQNQAHVVASDCHNCGSRAPRLAAAMDLLRRKLGTQQTELLVQCGDQLAGE